MLQRILFLAVLFAGLIIDSYISPGGFKLKGTFAEAWLILLSLSFSVGCLTALENYFKNKWARQVAMTLFLFNFILLSYYRTNTGSALDFSVIQANYLSIFSLSGAQMFFELVRETFVAANVFWSVIGTLTYLWVSKKWPLQTNPRSFRIAIAMFSLSFLFMTVQTKASLDPWAQLGVSTVQYYVDIKTQPDRYGEGLTPFSSAQIDPSANIEHPERKPNVIIIAAESLNRRLLSQTHDDGRPYAPFIQKLMQRENVTSFKKYYGNSIQTARGHFSILCGRIPSLQSVEFRRLDPAKIECLPKILKGLGYKTAYLQADSNIHFDNSYNFLTHQGIDDFRTLSHDCNLKDCWGGALSDHAYLERALDELQKLSTQSPYFAFLPTIAGHMPFNRAPEEQRHFYKTPGNRKEGYLNHLYLLDQALEHFFAEFEKRQDLQNNIVIITGDHSFPLGEHGNYRNETHAYQENFDVPLIIVDYTRKPLAPELKKSIQENPASHLNLANTILDLVGYQGPTPFIGPSVFSSKQSMNSPVYLVQPYSGRILAAIVGPYKYVYSYINNQERVFNLESDPQEQHEVPLETLPKDIQNQLREAAGRVAIEQGLFR